MSAAGSPERHAARDFGGVVAVEGVAALAASHDGFIVDQWGVLHDGVTPYPGAAECLEQLKAAGKRVVVLSNSARRDAENARLMTKIGLDASLYHRLVSAGEDARGALAARVLPFHRALGRRCFAFTRDGNVSLLEGLGLEIVDRIADADFLAVVGIDSPRRSLPDYEAELREGIARGLPMVCANPDFVRVSPEATVDAPGALARRYEVLGGSVFHHGKPWPAIYATCMRALDGCAPGRVIAVGDSMEHDILGASRAGLRSAFVAGGIHAAELGIIRGQMPDPEAWRRLAASAAARPDYLLPAFTW